MTMTMTVRTATRILQTLPFAAAMLLVTACATVHPSGFTRAQVAELQQQGFVENEEGWELSLTDRLLFDVNSAELAPTMRDQLQRVSTGLLRVGITSARVEGHSDATGTSAHNLELSEARARSVAAVMQQTGFDMSALAIRGWGGLRPIGDNSTEQGRSENRRVVIIVTAR